MRTTFRACNGMYLVEDQRADTLQILARARGEQQIQRLGGRDQDVGRVPKHRGALLLRRVAGAHAEPEVGLQPGERAAQVALDVVVQRLEGRDVDQAQALPGLVVELVDPVEEGRERLTGARRGLNQRVLAARDRRPAQVLGRRRRTERFLEPGAGFRTENGERVHPTRVLARDAPEEEDRRVGDVDVSGLAAVLVVRYDDDEAGSPWTIVLHVDAAGNDRQRAALADVFLGRLGGPKVGVLPWVRKARHLLEVRTDAIELVPDGDGYALRVGDAVRARATRPAAPGSAVRCVIPGYEEPGRELVADELVVDDDPFSWELTENCAFASRFAYASE